MAAWIVSSGDNPRSHSLGTFSPLFPTGNYFGVLPDTGPGTVNFIDVHPRLQMNLPRGVSISTDLVVQWRGSFTAGVCALGGGFVVPRASSRAQVFGYKPGARGPWPSERKPPF